MVKRFVLSAIIIVSVANIMGCVRLKPVYFNSSEKIESANAGEKFCSDLTYPCVRMSQGKYRDITTTPLTFDQAK